MKNPTTLIILLIAVAAVLSVESNDGEVFNPLPGGTISGTSTPYRSYEYQSSSSEFHDNESTQQKFSPYRRLVTLSNFTRSRYESAPGNENITISLSHSAEKPVNITGWQIWSVGTGSRGTIGQGTLYPQINGTGPRVPIVLQPRERAYIYTGRSPLEISFKPNICMGYLTDIRDFPRGVSRTCPDPEDSLLPLPFFDRDNECEEFIEDLSRCEVPYYDSDFPDTVSRQCQNYITSRLGYNECVVLWQNDEDFFLRDWIVYLGHSAKMYKDRNEKILLFDENGLLVDEY